MLIARRCRSALSWRRGSACPRWSWCRRSRRSSSSSSARPIELGLTLTWEWSPSQFFAKFAYTFYKIFHFAKKQKIVFLEISPRTKARKKCSHKFYEFVFLCSNILKSFCETGIILQTFTKNANFVKIQIEIQLITKVNILNFYFSFSHIDVCEFFKTVYSICGSPIVGGSNQRAVEGSLRWTWSSFWSSASWAWGHHRSILYMEAKRDQRNISQDTVL